MSQKVKTTVVGSYPVPSWLVGNISRLVMRDAVMAVLKTQELAGLDLITDGELMRFDPSHPEANGMVDYFASRMDGIRKHYSALRFRPLPARPGLGVRPSHRRHGGRESARGHSQSARGLRVRQRPDPKRRSSSPAPGRTCWRAC